MMKFPFPGLLRRALLPCCLAILGVAAFAGCSSVVNSHSQKEDMMSYYLKGDNESALDEIEDRLKEPAWYNSSRVNTGDELMWRLEAGSMNFHLGNFKESIDEFKIAEELIEAYDDRATVSVRDAGAEAGAALTNLNALPYRGLCRDRMALSIYKSLAYLGDGNEEAFHAQIRRLRNEQKKVQDDYSKYFEQEKAELDAQRKSNPEAAKQADASGKESDIVGSPDNAEFTAGLKEVRKVANKGYGNFLNPAAIFLSGLGSVRDGNFDNARIDFQRLCEAMPNNPMFKKYYATVLREANRDVPDDLAGVAPFDFPLDHDCVYVIFANGRSAAFKQIALYFPIMTAWPMCEFYAAPFSRLEAVAGGKTYRSEILADMDGILAQEFDERLPGMIARIVLNTLIKEAAYYGSITALAVTDMDPTVQAIAITSVAVGGAVYRAAMNTADTRSWEILPKEFQLTQFPMPSDRRVTLRPTGGAAFSKTIELPADCKSAIIFVDAPSAQNAAIHVLPMTTK